MTKAYITTSIPYVNGNPHIGFALEIIQADVLARYYKSLSVKTFFLTGTDENAIKNAQKAQELGLDVKKMVDDYAKQFYDLKSVLNLSFDFFIRTSSPDHHLSAQKFWLLCQKDIYKKKYVGLYCSGCESFYKDGEFKDNICPNHKKPLETIEEENYFFALSRYQKQLFDIISKDKIQIEPQYRKTEILNFINQGLEDFSISRPADRAYNWGIDVPGDSSQKIYVWFDALINYVSGLGFGTESENFKTFWLDNNNKIHFIGKDIIKFHLIYWPAMLLSARLPLPNKVFVHGFLTVNRQKISKTLGNVISPYDLVYKYGTDAVRYYFLREIPTAEDGDFSWQRFNEIYKSELSNELGNLVVRVTTLAEKDSLEVEFSDKEYDFSLNGKDLSELVENFNYHQAMAEINAYIKELNKKIDTFQPWKKSSGERQKFLIDMLSHLHKLGFVLRPFLPDTAGKILKSVSGKISKAQALFPSIADNN
ncbi:MAG: methionine--tRNA ligase [Patescibacteria group bacterium]|nr:MAG: methionine--tRNA ligase [Patescibacteria group bacterium]